MRIYTYVPIEKKLNGFGKWNGMWQAGNKMSSPSTSYSSESDLLSSLSDYTKVLLLQDALESNEFIGAGVENIMGKLYTNCGKVYARLNIFNELSYFEIVQDEVVDNFFNK